MKWEGGSNAGRTREQMRKDVHILPKQSGCKEVNGPSRTCPCLRVGMERMLLSFVHAIVLVDLLSVS